MADENTVVLLTKEPETKSVAAETQAATATLRRNYDRVFEDGTLVSLHVGMWSMSSQLREDDLELEKQPAIIKLGKKMLIHPDIFNKFKRIESRGRAVLLKNSFKFPIAEAHFVPNTKLAYVNEQLRAVKLEFDTYKQEFFDKYLEYKKAVLDTYTDLKEKLEPCYPTVEAIKTKFSFEWTEFRLAMPKEFGVYDLNAKIAEDKAVTELEKKSQDELRVKAIKQAKMIEDFVKDAGALVRETVLQGCLTIAEKIKRKEVITKTSLDTLIQKVTDFESLNFLDDKAVANRITELKALLNGDEDFRRSRVSLEKLDVALKSVIEETKKVTDIDELTGNYFRVIQLGDD